MFTISVSISLTERQNGTVIQHRRQLTPRVATPKGPQVPSQALVSSTSHSEISGLPNPLPSHSPVVAPNRSNASQPVGGELVDVNNISENVCEQERDMSNNVRTHKVPSPAPVPSTSHSEISGLPNSLPSHSPMVAPNGTNASQQVGGKFIDEKNDCCDCTVAIVTLASGSLPQSVPCKRPRCMRRRRRQ